MAENRQYTVHLDITELERGTKMSSKDTELTGLWVRGTTVKEGQVESWEKFLMDWNAGDYIEKLELAGIGTKVDIVMEKEGRFWNIKAVYDKGQASTPPASTSPSSTPPASGPPAETPKQQEMFQTPQVAAVSPEITVGDLKRFALERAIEITSAMMQAGIIKNTKSSPTVIAEGVLALADRLVTYLEDKETSEPKSDASPLAPVADEGGLDARDDSEIPFQD